MRGRAGVGIVINCDGAAPPTNPGHGSWAWVASLNGQWVGEDYGYLGDRITSNVAEFMAVLQALGFIGEM